MKHQLKLKITFICGVLFATQTSFAVFPYMRVKAKAVATSEKSVTLLVGRAKRQLPRVVVRFKAGNTGTKQVVSMPASMCLKNFGKERCQL
jgi:hypothetical protein